MFLLFYTLRVLYPRNIVSIVSELLDKTLVLAEQAEANGIPNASDYRAKLAINRHQFLQMRIESHRSPGVFQQFYLFILGFTWRLYVLKSQIEAIQRRLELAVDEHTMRTRADKVSIPSATTTRDT